MSQDDPNQTDGDRQSPDAHKNPEPTDKPETTQPTVPAEIRDAGNEYRPGDPSRPQAEGDQPWSQPVGDQPKGQDPPDWLDMNARLGASLLHMGPIDGIPTQPLTEMSAGRPAWDRPDAPWPDAIDGVEVASLHEHFPSSNTPANQVDTNITDHAAAQYAELLGKYNLGDKPVTGEGSLTGLCHAVNAAGYSQDAAVKAVVTAFDLAQEGAGAIRLENGIVACFPASAAMPAFILVGKDGFTMPVASERYGEDGSYLGSGWNFTKGLGIETVPLRARNN